MQGCGSVYEKTAEKTTKIRRHADFIEVMLFQPAGIGAGGQVPVIDEFIERRSVGGIGEGT